MTIRHLPAILAICMMMVVSPAAALDFAAIPHLNEKNRKAIQKDFAEGIGECRASYALAVSKNGYWAARCHPMASAADLARMVREKCEHLARQACGIVVSEGKVVPYSETSPRLGYPKVFAASKVPFVVAEDRELLAIRYEDAGSPKAIALTRNGIYGISVDAASEAEARVAALRGCELQDNERKRCFLYASGNKVLFTSRTNIFPDR